MTNDTSAEALKGIIVFPCCPQEKVMPYESCQGRASLKCPKCGKIALFDYDRMTARPAPPARGAVRKFKTLRLRTD